MSSDAPNEPGSAVEPDCENPLPRDTPTNQETHNMVSDLVIGVNFRKKDNLFQALFILITVLVLSSAGAIAAAINTDWQIPWYGGAMAGAFFGLVIGLLTSGVFLMIYRGLRHLKGKHD